MNKQESLNIRPIMNGYSVEYTYRTPKTGTDGYSSYNDEMHMFKTWDEVIDFLKNKQLETPPAKI